MMKPSLVIADGRKLLMRNGPTGGSLNDVKKGDTIVVGTDCTSVDSWCVTRLLEKPRHEILYLDKVINAAWVKTGGRSGRRRSRYEPGCRSPVQIDPFAGHSNHRAGRPVGRRLRVSDKDFWRLCQENPDLRLERTEKGVVEIMAPTSGGTGAETPI